MKDSDIEETLAHSKSKKSNVVLASGLNPEHLAAANGEQHISGDNPKGSLFAVGGLYQKLHKELVNIQRKDSNLDE